MFFVAVIIWFEIPICVILQKDLFITLYIPLGIQDYGASDVYLSLGLIFNARNQVVGSVMFLHLCVILFKGGSLSQHAPQIT